MTHFLSLDQSDNPFSVEDKPSRDVYRGDLDTIVKSCTSCGTLLVHLLTQEVSPVNFLNSHLTTVQASHKNAALILWSYETTEELRLSRKSLTDIPENNQTMRSKSS